AYDNSRTAIGIVAPHPSLRSRGAARSVIAMPTPSASKQLAGFIAKFEPDVAKVIRSCRAAMRKEFPTALELVYDNYNFFVIGYASTERASDGIVSIAAAANG